VDEASAVEPVEAVEGVLLVAVLGQLDRLVRDDETPASPDWKQESVDLVGLLLDVARSGAARSLVEASLSREL
jgi:hypothetical protein